jgi:hypothetical protein
VPPHHHGPWDRDHAARRIAALAIELLLGVARSSPASSRSSTPSRSAARTGFTYKILLAILTVAARCVAAPAPGLGHRIDRALIGALLFRARHSPP